MSSGNPQRSKNPPDLSVGSINSKRVRDDWKGITVNKRILWAIEKAFDREWKQAYKKPCNAARKRVWESSLDAFKVTKGHGGFNRSTILLAMEILAEELDSLETTIRKD